MMQPTADVLLYNLEAGSPLRALEERLADRVRVDFTDFRSLRFFRTLPQAFFDQYAQRALLENVDEAPEFFDEFVAWRHHHPQAHVVVAVYGSRPKINAWWSLLQQNNFTLSVVPVPASRTLRWCPEENRVELLIPTGGLVQAVTHAGFPQQDAGTLPVSAQAGWEHFFTKEFFPFLCQRLAVKKRDLFYEFLVALAGGTGGCANWTQLARKCRMTTPAVQKWVQGLADCAVIDIVPGICAAPPRRTLMRPRIFWNQPGLAAWLIDPTLAIGANVCAALQANLLYLAVKDRLPSASFSHFLDTNKVCVPLLAHSNRGIEAFFVSGWQGWERRGQALQSVSQIMPLTHGWAWAPLPEKYDGLFDLFRKQT